MPVVTTMVVICNMCGLTYQMDDFTDPVLACSELGWAYYQSGKCYCQDCQHKITAKGRCTCGVEGCPDCDPA